MCGPVYVAYHAITTQVCCGQLTGDLPQPEEQRIYRDMNPCNPEMKLLYVTPEKVLYLDIGHEMAGVHVLSPTRKLTYLKD